MGVSLRNQALSPSASPSQKLQLRHQFHHIGRKCPQQWWLYWRIGVQVNGQHTHGSLPNSQLTLQMLCRAAQNLTAARRTHGRQNFSRADSPCDPMNDPLFDHICLPRRKAGNLAAVGSCAEYLTSTNGPRSPPSCQVKLLSGCHPC